MPVAVIATWTARTVTDTDAFVARVTPVASSPEVQALVEQEITAQVTQAIDTRVAPKVTAVSAPPTLKFGVPVMVPRSARWTPSGDLGPPTRVGSNVKLVSEKAVVPARASAWAAVRPALISVP